jgi:hypothetical protein
MAGWGVRSSAAKPILECLTAAFAFDAAVKETKGNSKREPYNGREHTWDAQHKTHQLMIASHRKRKLRRTETPVPRIRDVRTRLQAHHLWVIWRQQRSDALPRPRVLIVIQHRVRP